MFENPETGEKVVQQINSTIRNILTEETEINNINAPWRDIQTVTFEIDYAEIFTCNRQKEDNFKAIISINRRNNKTATKRLIGTMF